MATPSNPLSSIDDNQLWNIQLFLSLLCGRNKWTQTKHRNDHFCILGQALKVEADLRGLPSPSAPYHVADTEPGFHRAL